MKLFLWLARSSRPFHGWPVTFRADLRLSAFVDSFYDVQLNRRDQNSRSPFRALDVSEQVYSGLLGVGTGTVCAGSNLLVDPASTFASSFDLPYDQNVRHIIVRKPTKSVLRGEGREERQWTAAIQYTN